MGSQVVSGKESACQCRRGDRRTFNPRSERFPGVGTGKQPYYSCLENSTDRETW